MIGAGKSKLLGIIGGTCFLLFGGYMLYYSTIENNYPDQILPSIIFSILGLIMLFFSLKKS